MVKQDYSSEDMRVDNSNAGPPLQEQRPSTSAMRGDEQYRQQSYRETEQSKTEGSTAESRLSNSTTTIDSTTAEKLYSSRNTPAA